MPGGVLALPRLAKQVVVDIADLRISNDPDVLLVTFALGSCVAVIAHDPVRRLGGMIHCMLPLSTAAPEKAARKPAMFADTGIPLLFEQLGALGARREELVVKVAGGGGLQGGPGVLNIGERNVTVLRATFAKQGIRIAKEDLGGTKSRTARLRLADGRVTITSKNVEVEL